jgi:hypothetical protein
LGRIRGVSKWPDEGQKTTAERGGDATHSIGGIDERVVDGNDLELGLLNSVAEDNATNSTEAVDSDLDGSHNC